MRCCRYGGPWVYLVFTPRPRPGLSGSDVISAQWLGQPPSGCHCKALAPGGWGSPLACSEEEAEWWHLCGQATCLLAPWLSADSSLPLPGRPNLPGHQQPCSGAGIQDPWLMPGPSQRPVCANLRAPVAPAHLAPGQPRVWSWNLAQSLWGGFGLAPPVGSWLPWRADATGEDSWGWQLMPPPTPHNILPPSLHKEYFSNAWPG